MFGISSILKAENVKSYLVTCPQKKISQNILSLNYKAKYVWIWEGGFKAVLMHRKCDIWAQTTFFQNAVRRGDVTLSSRILVKTSEQWLSSC